MPIGGAMYYYKCEVCGEKFKSEFPKACCTKCDIVIDGKPSALPIVIFISAVVLICAALVIIGRVI